MVDWSALQKDFETLWKLEIQEGKQIADIPKALSNPRRLHAFEQIYEKVSPFVSEDKRRDSIFAIIKICNRHKFSFAQCKTLIEGLYGITITKSILVGIDGSQKKGEAALSLTRIVGSLELLVNFAFSDKGTGAGLGADSEALKLLQRRYRYMGQKRLDWWNKIERRTENNRTTKSVAASRKLGPRAQRAKSALLTMGVDPELPSFHAQEGSPVYSIFASNDVVGDFFRIANFLLKQAKGEIALHKKQKLNRGKSVLGKPVAPEKQQIITLKIKELMKSLVGSTPRPARSSGSKTQNDGSPTDSKSILFIEDCRTALGFSAMKRETIIDHGWRKVRSRKKKCWV